MSERYQEILTREELAAILASEGTEADFSGPPAAWQQARAPMHRTGPLARALSRFADEQSRQLSTLHQRAIRFSLLGCESALTAEFAGSLISSDRAVRIARPQQAHAGAILIGRSLFYAWLTMSLGGPADTPLLIPHRPYSAIERRFLRVFARELSRQLERAFQDIEPLQIDVTDILEPEMIPEALPPRLWVACFDVSGFGDVVRLRIALPTSWIDALERAGDVAGPQRDDFLKSRLRDTPLAIRAEIGNAELALRELTELAVGDTIPLRAADGGSILVRLEDHPKFRAVLGSVGSRLAIRVVEEI